MKLKVVKQHPSAKLPEVAHPGEDFGYDVFACLPEESYSGTSFAPACCVIIQPGEQRAIPTGIAVEVGDGSLQSYGLIAKQPSGLALKRMLDVKAGVIDAGYRNEIRILLYNYGKQAQVVYDGDKIGQLVPIPVYTGEIEEVENLSESTRGLHGWGSGHKASTEIIDGGVRG
jgi:dUTP pyrophosphatase